MPGNGLTLSVGVSGQIQMIGFFDGLSDVFDVFLGFGSNLPVHLKIGIGTDGPILGGQISNMTITGQDNIITAQILINRFRLSWRLDDDNVATCSFFVILKFKVFISAIRPNASVSFVFIFGIADFD